MSVICLPLGRHPEDSPRRTVTTLPRVSQASPLYPGFLDCLSPELSSRARSSLPGMMSAVAWCRTVVVYPGCAGRVGTGQGSTGQVGQGRVHRARSPVSLLVNVAGTFWTSSGPGSGLSLGPAFAINHTRDYFIPDPLLQPPESPLLLAFASLLLLLPASLIWQA